jgi:hypothetical protein
MRMVQTGQAFRRRHLRWWAAACGLCLSLLAGCAALDEQQRRWIFQPSDRTWAGGLAAAEGMQDVWIAFASQRHRTGRAAARALAAPAGT